MLRGHAAPPAAPPSSSPSRCASPVVTVSDPHVQRSTSFFLNLLLPFVFRKVARADQHQNTHSERTSRPPLLYPTFVALVPNPLRHHPCGGQVFHGILAVLSTTGACCCGLCNGWVGVTSVRACVRAGGWVGGGHHGCHGSAIVICRHEPHVHDHLGTDMHTHMSMRTVPSSHAMHQCMMPYVVA